MTDPKAPARSEPTTQSGAQEGYGTGESRRVHQHGISAVLKQRVRRDLRNWRLMLVRIFTSAVSVVLTVEIVPGLYFTNYYIGLFLIVGIVFGLLNALVKPLLQFFGLRYIVVSYGLIVVLINAILLWMLGRILQDFEANSLLAVLIAAALVAAIQLALDTLLGASDPILDRRPEHDERTEL